MKKQILILIIFFLSFCMFADDSVIITLDKAVSLALENNLDLQAEKYNLTTKKRSRDTAGNAFYPSISTGASVYRYNNQPESTDNTWNLSASVSAKLDINLALFDGIKYLIQDYNSGLISYEDARKQLERDVKKEFYNLILLRENIKINKQSIKTAEERYNQALVNYKNGLAPELDVLSAQVSYENLKPTLKDVENDYAAEELAFKQLLGLERNSSIDLKGDIKSEKYSFDLENLISKNLSNRLDIQSLSAEIAKQKTNIKSQIHQNYMPTLSLAYTLDPAYSNEAFDSGWFNDVEKDWSQQSGMFTISVSMSLDSFLPGSSQSTNIKNTDDQIKQAELELKSALQAASTEIQTLVMGLEKSLASLESLELNLKLAEKTYNLASQSYRAGTMEYLDLKDIDDELQSAKYAVLQERYSYVSGLLDLEYSLNSSIDNINTRTEK